MDEKILMNILEKKSDKLIFLKLGGSLITDKNKSRTAQTAVLSQLADEIAAYRAKFPEVKLLIGHGSGSFGHHTARKYGTKQGVKTADDWKGFWEVWSDARELHLLVLQMLKSSGLKVMSFPPSSCVTADNLKVSRWNVHPIQAALASSLVPVVYGDTVFDLKLGGTILSTEDLFIHLAGKLHPDKIFLAGKDPGVWADYPDCTEVIESITPVNASTFESTLKPSESPDVTGGMAAKVAEMLKLVEGNPDLKVFIFQALEAGQLTEALVTEKSGTLITASN
jgi:isopentenyl phosphate kinase